MLSWIFIVLLTETTVRGWACRSIRTHYSDSEPTELFLLKAVCLAEKHLIPILESLNQLKLTT
jgi:hypothetical protein